MPVAGSADSVPADDSMRAVRRWDWLSFFLPASLFLPAYSPGLRLAIEPTPAAFPRSARGSVRFGRRELARSLGTPNGYMGLKFRA